MTRPCLCVGLLLTLLAVTPQFGAADLKDERSDGNAQKQTSKAERPKDSQPQPPADSSASQSETSRPVMLECAAADRFFEDEVWPKVGERTCLKCHQVDGDASESKLVLRATSRNRESINTNRAAFLAMATSMEKGRSRLLEKVSGGLDHGGGEVLAADTTGYRILERFVRRSNGTPDSAADEAVLSDYDAPPFFAGVQMMSPERLLRRVTLSLAGRLPTDNERQAVVEHGLSAMDGILDRLMTEDAFYERLKEGFNDIFLTLGYDGNGEEVLSYDHFQPTRLWYQKHDLTKITEKERQRARWNLADVYRDAIKREPLELIEFIVRNDHAFTELATADYIMVSPYSSRGYGVFEELKDQFKDPEDPFEYVPVKLKALKSRNGKVQDSATGNYPHAGFLSMFHYLRRYPTTETNRNRLRARMYYQHFLGIDVMALAPRVTDAAAVSAKYEVPTMQAADCVVCHKSIDPLAGLFQDFNEGGHLGPRKDGWYTDMFGPGFEGEDLPESDRWRALQWLGERTAKDPRFAVAMVEHVYYILMGRKVLQPPEDIDDPMFGSKRRACQEQRQLIEDVAQRFRQTHFNLKSVFKALVPSRFYRADGLATVAAHPRRRAELDDIGLVRLLTPEQLERKLEAVFGQRWGRLVNRESRFKILYGGIDSKSVTERMTDPSGAMGAIQRIMANDVACRNVALDFTREPAQRRLFPKIELDVVPGSDPNAETQIRQAIVYLHRHLLGREHSVDHPEVERTWQLFAGIISDAKAAKGIDQRGSYFCERVDEKYVGDPQYTLRAWRGVVTYLLRQHDFLYE
jgi:hypothetical protein